MASLNDSVTLFLQQTGLSEESLQAKLIDFFTPPAEQRHLLYKQSILYFFEMDRVVDSVTKSGDSNDSLGATVFSFDGEKISRISPEYYIGASDYSHSHVAWEFEIGFSDSNNCNNNNNNNNGNNNG